MNIKRYVAATTREAFTRVRAELGEDAIILKNRAVPEGVEILAMADDSVPTGQVPVPVPLAAQASKPERAKPSVAQPAPRAGHQAQASPDEDDDSMSTVNFEAYVRERRQRRQEMAADDIASEHPRRSQDASADNAMSLAAALARGPASDAFPALGLASPGREAPTRAQQAETSPVVDLLEGSPDSDRGWSRRPAPQVGASRSSPAPARAGSHETSYEADIAASRAAPGRAASSQATPNQAPSNRAGPRIASSMAPAGPLDADAGALMSELREMRGFLSDRLESMSWFEGVRRRPAQSRMLRLLMKAGFSAALSRKLADHLPVDFNDAESDQWLRAALRRNLRVDTPGQTIFDDGGVFALLGPTGVGKTTTAAKIGAQFALEHGADSVGLITADVYRIGAQDQLRTFGRLLGVPVHVAHDVATLADILNLFASKKLVLIDTAGVGQRDTRVHDLLAALSSAQVRKVVVLNAAVQAEAIDEVIEAYQADRGAGVVLSKIDEAVQLGGVLDCVIRHRLPLQGIANGQRVPEDWHRPDATSLIDRAMAAASSPRQTPFCFEEAELSLLFTAGTSGAWTAAPGADAGARSV